ncbi:MAG: hypothetical protein IPH20_01500 [Bacteroidales bacterium]|nr:hypothetical protein [Bacteroidales bacterium]
MDDFLYIIIGVVWVAYSLYNNKQKQDRKKAAREAGGNTPPEASPRKARSILEEILMGEMRPEPIPAEIEEVEYERETRAVPVDKPVKKFKTEAESLEVITEEVPANYFEHEYATRKDEKGNISEIKAELKEEEESEESDLRIAGEFDLKTAVIYAEILNPRYI